MIIIATRTIIFIFKRSKPGLRTTLFVIYQVFGKASLSG
jgi:hypothetical protein